jgi:hypothetical protein
VLKGIGDAAVVASICPRQSSDLLAADFAYRPAAKALIDRLAQQLE